MRLLLALVFLGAAFGEEWNLIWQDEFDILDPDNWEHEVTAWGGGNGEFQVYTPDQENSYIRDGVLFIKPTLLPENINPATGEPFGEDFLTNGLLDLKELYGNCTDFDPENNCVRRGSESSIPPTMSARLRTYQRFAFCRGRAELRAKMPRGDWLWPAMWMLPEEGVYGGWPMSGDIDIAESIGNEDLKFADSGDDIGMQRMKATTNWGATFDQNRNHLTLVHRLNFTEDFANYFHDYVIEWDENAIRWFLDGELILSAPDPPANEQDNFNFFDFGAPWAEGTTNPWEEASQMAPFDQDLHFILSVAVGGVGGYFPDDVINRGDNAVFGKPWNNTESQVDAMWNLWDARDRWLWTWEGEDAAMQVDYIRVYQKAEE
ncbi:hypothetical protein CAPTEDRAFT_128848 [Capitella teleta]|uniref:GH16 domain-containing protein n=1 Tax=Capitella teleta TaxID=283909 RepID=R7VKQ6_CAPTE|nr:hypothetical protein CAPTEDRAFT_128848 [Capitella teleta]|eukprot:ELU17581.1 hypothetical protein CAPTEDRAFT_128848 [Capitella teleta]